jgi:hypothetical protein
VVHHTGFDVGSGVWHAYGQGVDHVPQTPYRQINR